MPEADTTEAVDMREWEMKAPFAQPGSIPPASSFVHLVPAGRKARLKWLSITLVTGAIPGNRQLRIPYKQGGYDPSDMLTRIKTQGPNLTNHYCWMNRFPVSDAANQVWRTFPLNGGYEVNDHVLKTWKPEADSFVQAVTGVLPGDQFYVNWAFVETWTKP